MGNLATIASCKCNKQQDHGEMDLNKDKQELLKNRKNSKQEDENFNEAEYQNQNINIDNIKFGEIGIQNKNPNESLVTPGDNYLNVKDSEKTNQETFQNNIANATPFSAIPNNDVDIKQYSHNLNNKNTSNHNFAVKSTELENYSNNANLNPKTFSHLKSNSNEIKMDIYEDENAQDLNNNQMLKNLKNQISNRKKYNNSNTNSSLGNQNQDGVKQSPLEIINENNADASKESFYENISITKKLNNHPESNEIKAANEAGFSYQSTNINQQAVQNQLLNVDAEIKKIDNSIENGFYNSAIDNSNNENTRLNNDFDSNKNSKSIDNSGLNIMSNYNSENIENQNIPKMNNINHQLNNNLKEDINKNYSSYQGYKSNQPMQQELKSCKGQKKKDGKI